MKVLRIKCKLTQKQLSRKTGISQSYISAIENGHISSLTIDKILILAAALYVTPTELFEELLRIQNKNI